MMNFREKTAKMTIQDMLAVVSISAVHGWIPCLTDDSSNIASFCGSEDVFYCLSCGASRGLIGLAEFLHMLGNLAAGIIETNYEGDRLKSEIYDDQNSRRRRKS